ncbi:MAG: adenylosuccinate lyase [Candidatus Actinomarina sp.]|jgi:adenylosuccinate lyase|tara:strand:- start:8648 stop:9925 length:1278 start_codon:yes stop_codon:yes gene_type:complete
MIERYSSDEMSSIWSEDNKVAKWLDVERAVIEILEKEEITPKGLSKQLKEVSITHNEVLEREAVTNHDLAAFVDVLQSKIQKDSNWIHYGLTSSDVVDTANALLIKESLNIVVEKIAELVNSLKNKAISESDTLIIGRTHGVYAEPTTLGSIFGNWCLEVSRGLDRLSSSLEIISYGKISGAVGNHSLISEEIENKILEQLSLKPEPLASQIVSRDRYADLFSSFAIIAGTYERIATNIRHYQRSEVGEMYEAFKQGQKGSSAMPHKKNPIGSERICGLARVVRGNTQASYETMALWHERDISNSSVERIILPDTFKLIDFMTRDLINIINDLVINHENIESNLNSAKTKLGSQKLLSLIVSKGNSRDEGYKFVQNITQNNFSIDAIIESTLSEFDDISKDEIENCFNLTTNIDSKIIEKKLKEL